MRNAIPVVETRTSGNYDGMKMILLFAVVTTTFLGACSSYSHRGEIATDIPPHDTVVRDQIPSESGRKIPVVQQY